MKKEDICSNNYLQNVLKLIILILVYIQIVSCKKEADEKVEYVKFGKTNVVFPDTLILNKKYKGYVLYSSLFDTLNLKLVKDRYINLYIKGNDRKTEYSELKKIEHDTFVIYEDTIRFIVNFDKLGKNYLNGFIEDEVYIENKDSTVRIINKIIPFHKEVFVKNIDN